MEQNKVCSNFFLACLLFILKIVVMKIFERKVSVPSMSKFISCHRLYNFFVKYLLLTILRSCRNLIKVVYVYYSTYYNACTTLKITISHYIILLYNTLLRTVRIKIHYYFPGCSYCSCFFLLSVVL